MPFAKQKASFKVFAKTAPGHLALLALAALPKTQAQPAKPADETVDLPLFVIKGKRALPPPESWRYVRIPDIEVTRGSKKIRVQGAEILSNDMAKNLDAFAYEYQLRQVAAALFWPALSTARHARPPVIILDRNIDPIAAREDNEDALVAWEGSLLDENGPAAEDFMTATGDLASGNSAPIMTRSIGAANPLPSGISVLRTIDGIVTVKVRGGMHFFDIERQAGVVSNRLLVHALKDMTPRPPLWLESGLGWLIETMEVNRERLLIGAEHLAIDRKRWTLAPLKLVLEGDLSAQHDDAAPSPKEKNYNTRLTAIAFVHFGLYGDASRHAADFVKFADRASREPVTEEVFRECFRMSYEKMHAMLVKFATDTAIYRTSGVQTKLPPMPAVEVREATQSEIGCLQAAEFWVNERRPQALEVLRLAYARGERSPRLLEDIAYFEEKEGNIGVARKLMAALKNNPSPGDRAFITQARLGLRDARGTPDWPGKLKREDTLRLLKLVFAAARMQPSPSEEVCELAAVIVLESEGLPGDDIVSFLRHAARLHPENERIQRALELAGE